MLCVYTLVVPHVAHLQPQLDLLRGVDEHLNRRHVMVLQQVSTMPFLVTEKGHKLAIGDVPDATGSLSICSSGNRVRVAIVSSSVP